MFLRVTFLFIFFLFSQVFGHSNENEYCNKTLDEDFTYDCYGYQNSLPSNLDPIHTINLRMAHKYDYHSHNNSLPRLTDGILLRAHLPNLKYLRLSQCGIRVIEKGAFKGGEFILRLWLSNNFIEFIDPSVFQDLLNIEWLDLGLNPLKEFDGSREFPKINLRRVFFSECQLTSLPTNLLRKLENLTEVYMGLNQITTDKLNLSIFSGLENLKHLDFWGNPFHNFGGNNGSNIFPKLNLTVLVLSACQIRSIHPNTFKNLEDLDEIHFYSNQLTVSDLESFRPLKKLRIINLEENCIEDLAPLMSIFEDMPNLEKLDLSSNKFNEFDKDLQFPELADLTDLSLSNCHIHSIPKNLLKNLKELEFLELGGNHLTTMDWRMLQQLKNLKQVGLYDNPWHCDCRIRFFLKYLRDRVGISSKEKMSEFLGKWSLPSCNSTYYSPTNSPNDNLVVGKNWTDVDPELLLCPPEILSVREIFSLDELQVQEANQLTKLENNTDIAGKTIKFRCKYSGFPAPVITWKKNGTILEDDSTKIKIFLIEPLRGSEMPAEFAYEFSQDLIIINAEANDEGEYECEVSNSIGNATQSIYLNLMMITQRSATANDDDAEDNFEFKKSLLIICLPIVLLISFAARFVQAGNQ